VPLCKIREMGVRCGTGYPLLPLGDYHEDGSLRYNCSQCFMEKIEKILEKCKIYIGVRNVAVEIRTCKTRTAFTNLTSSPPTIYINEYLIDDEEIVEYLIIRELIHIKLHMYRSRYTGGLSYAEKFENTLYFLIPKEKVEEITSTWYILAGITIPVGLYLSVFTCGE
jgi:hypothetical protein